MKTSVRLLGLLLLHLLLITTVMGLSNIARVPVHRNANYKADGTKSLVWLFHKYGMTPTRQGRFHRNKEHVLMKRQTDGSSAQVTTDDQQNDSFYTCPVQIGTPAQTLNLDFDSGSSDFWTWSTHLPSHTVKAAKASGAPVFNPDNSSTFKTMPGSTWYIQYGDSSVASGTVGTDNVKIGNITIENQAIELASKISSQLQNQTGSRGLVGLAFGSINTVRPKPVHTPLENMILQHDIPADQQLFTCYLGSYKDANDPDHGKSFYTFGAIDQGAVQSSGQQISYVPIDNSKGFWMFDSPSVVLNGQTINLANNQAVADTGTTLMLVSDQICDQFYGAIDGAEFSEDAMGWIFPADTPAESLPTISFAVGNTLITIEKEHYAFAAYNSTMVYGGIQSQGSLGFSIFGDVFLQSVYAIFDAGNMRFGVVQRADPTPNGPQA
ncbi:Penicillopepsin-1 [Exophiala dermatitidis]